MRLSILVLALLAGLAPPAAAQGELVPTTCIGLDLTPDLRLLDFGSATAYLPMHELSTDPTHGGFEITEGPGGASVGRWVYDYDSQSHLSHVALLLEDDGGLEPYERTRYTYDAAGRLATETEDEGDGAGGWTPINRNTFVTYDASGNLTERAAERWDAAAGEWAPGSRETLAYTESRLTEYTSVQWNPNAGEYTPDRRYLFGYDAQGRRNEAIEQLPGATGLENHRRVFVSSFIGSEPIEWIVQFDDEGAWRTVQRDRRESSEGGGLVVVRESRTEAGEWRYRRQRHLSFSGALLTESSTLQRELSGRLVNVERVTLGYEGNRVSEFRLFTDPDDDGTWDLNSRRSCVYGSAGRIVARESASGGTPSDRTTYTYDSAGVLQTRTRYDWNGAMWEEDIRFVRFDRATDAEGTPHVETATLAVAPNPAVGRVTVALTLPVAGEARVEALDVLGRRVAVLHEGPLAAGAHRLALPTSALPSGAVVVRAVTEAGTVSRTVTVVR